MQYCMVEEAHIIKLFQLMCIIQGVIARIDKDGCDVSFSATVLLEIFCCKKNCNAKKVL